MVMTCLREKYFFKRKGFDMMLIEYSIFICAFVFILINSINSSSLEKIHEDEIEEIFEYLSYHALPSFVYATIFYCFILEIIKYG